ncbi:helix-turn-helix transcriptional regulator [Clostridium sp. Marseille-P2415]|uniref:helix-turn-helix transcriptional regulator n=1 Tax=Clostridium sp. Marseille-P2415 TaxID=1805471 RepID=UPI0009884F87|nr:helix-turn-helix transcriptional regulator [Clostridium sp. Marseille-P2415]
MTKLTLKELAEYAGDNESYLSSLFKKMVGINFYKYLNRVRMQRAITELLTTDKPIADIAIDNGFSDVKSFNAIFLESFQKRPSEYRRNKQRYLSELSTLNRRFISDDHPKVREDLLQHADQQKYDQDNNIISGKISATVPVSSVTFMFDLDNPLKQCISFPALVLCCL